MMILPLICILAGFVIYSKKFKIDEKTYEMICRDLEARAGENEEDNLEDWVEKDISELANRTE